MASESPSLRVLWLTPDKPTEISVGRERIANHLASEGMEIALRGTSLSTVRRSIVERNQFDVVIGTTRVGAIAAVGVGALGGLPVVVDHIDPISQLYQTESRWVTKVVEKLEHAAFRLADHVLYVYDEEQDRVARHAKSFTKTDLGVDFDCFADPSDTSIITARDRLQSLGLEDDILVYIGGLEPIYNISSLLDAMEHLPEWTLVIAGTGTLEPEVTMRAVKRENIEYLGTVPHGDVPGYLHHANVGISLVDDPHTLKVLEYLAASVPVVQLDGRARQRLGDHVTYTSLDPLDVAQAIRRAGDQKVSEETRSFVRQYSWSNISEVYARALRTVQDP